ncbi:MULTISPECIES: hypothetical protein [Psychrilyobacter]|uniref:Uncharacterized protein n=1 Tax=Psychrilyobacter piezotolerans TaxID=2293438 RepID=A0ABX9KJG8_9FUSO|nr:MULTISPECIES: hypothetical protein [Psychrilyobacter]MCS5422204.1 hypothetical protein [Psychrilyobacter sp. S5]NDI77149.1 hypothetical protein [Psychrilyobacter piezotolerans]RDE64141.1 hypothetical protein DV867_04220 [Psychrilyobacter sp. S5]REI42233.1 hypothetical protein DYH56_04220 [Psychrilyobacter piezotolerans]
MFKKELDMSDDFKKFLSKQFKNKSFDYIFELEGITGIPDCILFEKSKKNLKYIVTLEFKLKNWKRAIEQAIKATLYSNLVFVVMDKQGINAALKNIDDFKKRNIGLAFYGIDKKFKIHFFPEPKLPISDNYSLLLYKKLVESNKIENSSRKYYLWNKMKKRELYYKLKKFKS